MFYPRMTNTSISIHLQQPGDENGYPPVRYRPAGCGNRIPIGWFLIGWGLWSQRAARVAPPAKVAVPPDPERIMFYPRMRSPSTSLQLQQRGDENRDRPGRYRAAGCRNPTPLTDWLGLTEPARGENCPSGQRRGPAAPGKGKATSPDQKSFHTSITPTIRGRKR